MKFSSLEGHEIMKKMKTRIPFVSLLGIAVIMMLLNGCNNQKPLRVNDILAPFSGTDLKGNTIALASYKNQPVIVRFFLVNCTYCIADTHVFNESYDKYHKKGLEIVYINNDAANVTDVEKFSDTLAIPFPVIYDPKGRIAQQYDVTLQPLTLVLSPEHKILAALLGGVSEGQLDELLEPYFKG